MAVFYESLQNRIMDGRGAIDAGWVYASSTTMTTADGFDYTGIIAVGNKITWVEGVTQKSGYITVRTYSAGQTTITILGDSVTNTTLSDIYISASDNMVNHKIWFDYSPTVSGLTVTNPTGKYAYMITGKDIEVKWRNTAGTSNATSFSTTLPIASANIADMIHGATWWEGRDNGALLVGSGRVYVNVNSNSAIIDKDHAGGAWTASGTKRVSFIIKYQYAT